MVENSFDFVVIGGGIAGVAAIERILQIDIEQSCKILLITPYDIVKSSVVLKKITRVIEFLDIQDLRYHDKFGVHENVSLLLDVVVELNPNECELKTERGNSVYYKKLIICSGASPKKLPGCEELSDRVITIRDTESAESVCKLLKNYQNVAIVGNGGIALDIVYQLKKHNVNWIIRDDHIGKVFFDAHASEFLLDILKNSVSVSNSSTNDHSTYGRSRFTVSGTNDHENPIKRFGVNGSALGPDWALNFGSFSQVSSDCSSDTSNRLNIYRNVDVCSVKRLENDQIILHLSDGNTVECDMVIVAIGVIPNVEFVKNVLIRTETDGSIIVDHLFQTSINNLYAAGDCCKMDLSACNRLNPDLWYQMRLWNIARLMGIQAANSAYFSYISSPPSIFKTETLLSIQFEVFGHVTEVFGKKVCFLGLYNGQNLDQSRMEIILRSTPNQQFMRVVLYDGRMIGALIVGDSDLEETFENLIISKIDLNPFKDELLEDNVDIADFFD